MNNVTKVAVGVAFSSLVIAGFSVDKASAATLPTQSQVYRAQVSQADYNNLLSQFNKLEGKRFGMWDYSPNVRIVQQALTYLGYRLGPADGIYGQRTNTAMTVFELDHGMKLTGVFGYNNFYAIRYALKVNPPRIKSQVNPGNQNPVVKPTPSPVPAPVPTPAPTPTPAPAPAPVSNPVTPQPVPVSTTSNSYMANPAYGISQGDLDLLAHVVYSEARGESYTGQVAVAAVVLNRLKSPLFPKSIAGIIYEPWAFTSVYDGQFNLPPNKEAYQAAQDAIKGWDPTNGALYYWNPATATSPWVWSRHIVTTIGQHVFAL